ncbi:exosome complex protein Rrp42 [Candidatus Micrarchaeota archaeon]|nr:exosome complex protein Rrp42 [Candidatus Micrarchaeota archaeon]
MGEELKDIIMSSIRRDILINTLNSGKRFDGRAFDEYRTIKVQFGAVTTAEGSARVSLGNTQVLVATKFDVLKPFADRPTEGVLMTNGELLPLASPSFEPGPPNEDSIEMARVVDRAIRSAECVDLDSFFIEEEKVLGLYVDIYVLNHDGNYTDAAAIAASAALLNTQVPKVEKGKILRGDYKGPLNPKPIPIATSFVKIGSHWLVDPSRDEELVAETKITIATTTDHVCAMQKGKGSLSKEELFSCMEIAFKRGNEIRKILME